MPHAHKLRSVLKRVRTRTWIALGMILTLLPVIFLALYRPSSSAAWYDDSYAYRKKISFTHNADLSDRRVEITVDTATLISEGKMQADCDDSRFTGINGRSLLYELTGTCNNASTTYDVVFPTVVNGSNVGYIYYGNPSAVSASVDVSGYTALTPSGGTASVGSEETGTAPLLYWQFNEGYGTTANDATVNNHDGTVSGATWTTEELCKVGKCLQFDGTDDYVSMTTNAAIQIEQDESFTLSSWFRKGPIGGSAEVLASTVQTGSVDTTTTVDTAGTSATANSFQHKTWHDNTYYWIALHSDADNRMEFWYSSDGDTWTENTNARIAVDTSDFEVGHYHHPTGEYDSYNVIVYRNGYDIEARYISSPGTSFSWGSAEVIFDGDSSTNQYTNPTVHVLENESGGGTELSVHAIHYGPSVDTITVNGQNTDESIWGTNSSYSTARSTSTSFGEPSTFSLRVGQNYTGGNYSVYRLYYSFDTSSIPDGATITEATYNGGLVIADNSSTDFDVQLYRYSWNEPIDSGNREANYDGAYGGSATLEGTLINSANAGDALMSTEVDPSGINDTGDTRYVTVSSRDVSSTTPSGQEYVDVYDVTALESLAPDYIGLYSPSLTISYDNGEGNVYTPEVRYLSATDLSTSVIPTVKYPEAASTNSNYYGRNFLFSSSAAIFYEVWMDGTTIKEQSYATDGIEGVYGSVTTVATGTSGMSTGFSAVMDEDGNIHLTYIDSSGNVKYMFRDVNDETWDTAVTIDSGSTNTYPVISKSQNSSGVTDELQVIWEKDNSIYFKSGVSPFASGNWDASPTEVVTGGTNAYISTQVYAMDVENFFIWTDSDGKVKFQSLDETSSSGSGDPGGYSLQMETDGDLTFTITDGTNTDTVSSTAATYDDNKWHNVVAVKAGSSSISLYIDGVQVATDSSLTSGDLTSDGDLYVGIASDGSSNPWSGFLDEFKMYGVALNDAQIGSHLIGQANSGGFSVVAGAKNTDYLSDGLIGYWRMDESSGNATDSSGNDYTLTDNNTVARIGGEFGNGSEFVPASSEYFSTASTVTGIKTVSFWVNPDSNTNNYINLTSSAQITSSSGTLSATGVTSPTIYVNGVQNSTVVADSWQLVTITTETAIDADQFYVGRASSSYFDGTIDEVRAYNRALSPDQIQDLYQWAPGPVGYWSFNENTGTSTAQDISGYGNTGTFNGSLTAEDRWVPGRYGSALEFDGTGDYVDVGSDSSLDLQTLTISGWIKTASTSGARTIVGSSSNSGYQLRLENSTNKLQFLKQGIASVFTAPDGSNITNNEWTHIATTYDEDGNYIAYVNGIKVVSGTNDQSFTNSNILIGQGYNSGEHFNGVLDEVKIYNYVRTPSQIVQDLNGGHPVGGSPVGSQVAYWAMDEQQGSTINNTTNETFTTSISGATWKTQSDCKVNGCLEFDGTDDVVTITNESAIDLNDNLSTGHAFSTWIYADTQGEGGLGQVYQKGTNTFLRVREQDGTDIDVEASLDLATTDATLRLTAPINILQWNHIAVSYTDDSNDEITIWINGKNYGSSSDGVGSPATDSNDLLLGGTTTANFDGKIDEFKIYSTELSSDQIQLEYNLGKALNFGIGTNEAEQLSDGAGDPPVGYWTLDEKQDNTCTGGTNDVCDRSGNGNDGTKSGAVWDLGKIGSALRFDGSDDYVDIPNNSIFNITDNTLTIEAWVKRGTSTATGPIVEHGTGAVGGYGLSIGVSPCTTHQIKVTKYGVADICIGTFPADTEWHHVVEVGSASGMVVYIDGIPVGTSANTSSWTTSSANLQIGGHTTTTVSYFNGSIDEVKIYDYARTQAQIAYDYNRGAPVAHWRFDECTGTTAYDASGNGLNGTITAGDTSGSNDSVGTCEGSAGEMWADGASGKYNASVEFDGTNDYIDMGTPTTLGLTGDAAYTLSVWAKPSATRNDGSFVSYGGADSNNVISINSDGSGNIYSVHYGDDHSFATAWQTGVWQMVTITYDPLSSTERLYVNGEYKESWTPSNLQLTSGETLSIGRASWNGVYVNTTLIDDVRIYNYALSAEQVKKLMNDNFNVNFSN